MKTNWLTETLATAVKNRLPISLITRRWKTERGVEEQTLVRVYDRAGNTIQTFNLNDFTDAIQDAAIDVIYPAL